MSKSRVFSITLAGLVAAAALGLYAMSIAHRSAQRSESTTESPAYRPFVDGLGEHSRTVATRSPVAQRYFDQGLSFLYGFDQEQAFLSFEAAAEADPDCAMAYWGMAMAHGPNINSPSVDAAHSMGGFEAARRARALATHATPVERDLIDAIGQRFALPPPVDRKPLDAAYAAAMRRVWKAHLEDGDVGALAAAAILEQRPWDAWAADGSPRPGTEEAVGILQGVLAEHPAHPYALHMLVHALEASPHPERADAAADRLRALTPLLEHLLHMPSHIDIRRGRWQAAVTANETAIAADKECRRQIGSGDSYRLPIAHDDQMLAYAAMMQGSSRKAVQAIDSTLVGVPAELMRQVPATFDVFTSMRYEVEIRFGRWEQVLDEPRPAPSFPIALAMWHYARGVAFAAKKEAPRAREEQRAFVTARKSIAPDAVFRRTPVKSMLDVAESMLAGEILYREGKVEAAIAALREAVAREDALPYHEPPMWLVPVRHALAATLLDAGRPAEAEAVYRDDLARHPENGWSLFGLARSLRMQDRPADASTVTARFEQAWRQADVKLTSSCYCLPDGR